MEARRRARRTAPARTTAIAAFAYDGPPIVTIVGSLEGTWPHRRHQLNGARLRTYWEARPLRYRRRGYRRDRGVDGRVVRVDRGHAIPDEPFIHSVAQFTRHRDRKLLEIGVGAGTDHLQFARAGAVCHGVDLHTGGHRRHSGSCTRPSTACRPTYDVSTPRFSPFDDESFDVVYSWGSSTTASNPLGSSMRSTACFGQGGEVIAMMYKRRSLYTYSLWVRHGLLRGRPLTSLHDTLWNHMESVGAKKGYTYRRAA